MNSTRLKNNYIKEENLQLKIKDLSGYQAHHIIPIEVVKNYANLADKDEDEYYDGAWNCLLLPEESEYALCNHKGSHPEYTKYVGRLVLEIMNDRRIDFKTAAREAAELIRTFYNDNETAFLLDGEGGQKINELVELIKYVENKKRTK